MTQKAKEVLFKLLAASDEDEVKKIIESGGFFKKGNWKPYGGYYANFNTIHSQQPNPVAALVEKPINSIDALLLKECKIRNIDPESDKAQKSMHEAVEQFFDIKEGDFSELSQTKRRELATNIRIIAEGYKERPNIIVADCGEGQHPNDFQDTFLKLHGSKCNKVNIRFVQGKYYMGSTGVLPYCGVYHFQLILSRKTPELLKQGQEDKWGWTLVRLHSVKGTEYKNSWYEYYVDEEDHIPSFPAETLPILPNGEYLESGSYIKMFNYGLERPSVITLDLWRDINKLLYMPALPILLHETRDYRGHSPSKVLLGNKIRIMVDDRNYVEDRFTIIADLGEFGKRNIEVTLFKEGTSKTEFTSQKDAIFFTINGQVHATIGRSFLKTKAKLPYLSDYLMVHIDCTDVDTNIRETTFMSSRDRMRNNENSRKIEIILANELRNHECLKKWNQFRREQVISKNPKDKEFMERLVSRLIENNRSLINYLGLGGKIKDTKQVGPTVIEKYEGMYFPTYLKIKNWDSRKGLYRKEMPINSFAVIRLETDVTNDYFDRAVDNGQLLVKPTVKVKSCSLYNGTISLKIAPKDNAKVGEVDRLTAELTRVYDDSLFVDFEVKYTSERKPIKKPPIKKPTETRIKEPKGESYGLPVPILVYKEKREEYPCWAELNWTSEDIAKVEASGVENNGENKEENLDAFINMDAEVLHDFLRRKQVSQRQQELIVRSYETSIFLHSLLIYNELKDLEERDNILPSVMKGISKITLDLIWNDALIKELESD